MKWFLKSALSNWRWTGWIMLDMACIALEAWFRTPWWLGFVSGASIVTVIMACENIRSDERLRAMRDIEAHGTKQNGMSITEVAAIQDAGLKDALAKANLIGAFVTRVRTGQYPAGWKVVVEAPPGYFPLLIQTLASEIAGTVQEWESEAKARERVQ